MRSSVEHGLQRDYPRWRKANVKSLENSLVNRCRAQTLRPRGSPRPKFRLQRSTARRVSLDDETASSESTTAVRRPVKGTPVARFMFISGHRRERQRSPMGVGSRDVEYFDAYHGEAAMAVRVATPVSAASAAQSAADQSSGGSLSMTRRTRLRRRRIYRHRRIACLVRDGGLSVTARRCHRWR